MHTLSDDESLSSESEYEEEDDPDGNIATPVRRRRNRTRTTDGYTEGKSGSPSQDTAQEGEEGAENVLWNATPKKQGLKKGKRLRIRAEKLLDHKFARALFNKKVGVKQIQSLVKRLSDILEMVDPEKSGYVTWQQFGRTVAAVAPPELLRSDIDEFLTAQANDAQGDYINYHEFLITGKVTIIEKIHGRSVLPINGWLERQRKYTGDASTHTWQNHLNWYVIVLAED